MKVLLGLAFLLPIFFPVSSFGSDVRIPKEIGDVMVSEVLWAADVPEEEKKGEPESEPGDSDDGSMETDGSPMRTLEQDRSRATGPITSKIHHPLFFGLLFPTPDRADLIPQGKWGVNFNVNYSNILFRGTGQGWDFETDLEVGEFEFDVSYGVKRWAQVGVQIPIFYFTGGFLDNFVEGFHDFTGFQGSSNLPPAFSYTFDVFTDGKRWGVPDHGEAGFGDVTLYGKFELYKNPLTQSYLSVKVLTQPPTGNSTRGIGSGIWDNGIMLLGQKGWGKFYIHANVGGFFYDKMEKGDVDIELDPIGTGFIGFEYVLSDRWAFHLQSLFISNPIKDDAGDKGVDRSWMDITFGTKIRIGPTHLTIGLSENITETAPDFTFITALEFVK
jgi:hypothetical protein